MLEGWNALTLQEAGVKDITPIKRSSIQAF